MNHRFKRRLAVWLAMYAHQRRKEVFIPYDSTHRADFRVRFPRLPARMDCSEFVSWVLWNAGCKTDPSGNNWEDAYTRDMWDHGHEVTLFEALPGDLVFYENGNSHVAFYLGNDKVMSKGNDDGPVIVELGYRPDIKFIRSYF